jgi:hypothetical protein
MERQHLPEVFSPEPARACRTCRFWQAHLPELILGECRIHGPMFRDLPDEIRPSTLTTVDDWCAQWHVVRAARRNASA